MQASSFSSHHSKHNKKYWRSVYLQKRLAMGENEYKNASEFCCQQVEIFLQDYSYKTLLMFYPHQKEVQVLYFLDRLLNRKHSSNIKVFFPRVISASDMQVVECRDYQNEIQAGYRSIGEPATTQADKIYTGAIDVVLVPGIAFNENKFRLGYGSGFYDRFLSKTTAGLTIGCFFAWQLCAHFPVQANDVPMDVIITDKKNYV